ncbi:MAG: carbonic anhydrase [Nitrosomonadales bacterium]|nr:carbonic anhydrase [Nitrosomonadales bacterium]
MFRKYLATLAVATAFVLPSIVAASEHGGDVAVAQAYIKEIQSQEKSYKDAHKSAFFKELAKGQHPRATVVTCSDSRVHTNMLDKTPEGDLFMIRNIGNQLATAKGSVQYGVNHLGSSLLLFIGHSSCGAIKAASGDYSTLEEPIKKELDAINIAKGVVNIDGVKTNVNNQVDAALKEWADKVKSGELLIVGAVYDFADDMKLGAGNLNIINMNGETDTAKIRDMSVPAKKVEHGHDHH